MADERTTRVVDAVKDLGADWAILTSVDAVFYATGFDPSIEWGPSPFAGGPTAAFVGADGTTALLTTQLEQPLGESSRADSVHAYEGSYFFDPPLVGNYSAAARAAARSVGFGGRIAVEHATMPFGLASALDISLNHTLDITDPLARARLTKTETEIHHLSRSGALSVLGQQTVLQAAQAGRSELEVFADVRCAMERAAGERLAVTGDLLTGVDRTAACDGWPIDRSIAAGDPLIADLAPKFRGYWGDSANTILVDADSADDSAFAALFHAAECALEYGAAHLRPGISSGVFDSEVRRFISDVGFSNPVHIGHGIGTTLHEEPRIYPGGRTLLEPDMVVMLEPGAYMPGIGGVRLEWMFRITPTGCVPLAKFGLSRLGSEALFASEQHASTTDER